MPTVILCANKPLSALELKGDVEALIRSLIAGGAHIHIPRADQDYAVEVGLRMLLLRHFVEEEDGLYRANPREEILLRYYANSIAHLARGARHEVAAPVTLLENLRPALKPGARVGIIDREGNGTDHGVSRKIVIEEAEHAGYRLLETYDFVKADKMDYFLVFAVR